MADERIAVVTGARGFLAKNLIRRLRRDGWTVHGVSREGGTATEAGGLSWDAFWGAEAVRPSSVKAVFHLAAFIPRDLEDSAHANRCLEVNALLTLRLAEFMAERSRARFIYCSSGQAYRFQELPADESTPVSPIPRACFYLSSKLLGETYVERTRVQRGLDAAIFRVGSCYGAGMPERSLVARFSDLAGRGEPLPLRHGGAERFDLIHVDDVAEVLARAADLSGQGVFNLGSGRAVSVKSVAGTVNEIFGNVAGVRLDGAQTPPVQPGFAPLCMRRTIATFGWEPCALREGVGRHYDWLRARLG